MAGQIEHLHVPLPDRVPPKHFMHGNSFAVNRAAPVQLFNRRLETGYVVLFILHNVNEPFDNQCVLSISAAIAGVSRKALRVLNNL